MGCQLSGLTFLGGEGFRAYRVYRVYRGLGFIGFRVSGLWGVGFRD